MKRLLKYLPLLVLPYLGFWLYGLTDLDEGFYGAVTVDMLRRGDWITPTLNGVPWFEKPILSYWLAMPSVALFPNEFGARLPSFMCTLATAVLLAWFGRRIWNEEAGLTAALIFSGSLLVVAIGRMMMTDAPLDLCLTGCLISFYWSLKENRPRWRWLSGACLGLAVLAKGPVGMILFAGIAIATYLWIKPLRPSFRGGWAVGTLLFALIVASWYVPAYLVNGDVFIQKFLIEQNVGRFRGGDTAHQVPIWAHPIYYPGILALAALPWTSNLFHKKFYSQSAADSEGRFLVIWLLVVLGFFTISGTKLVHYILPAVPPLCLLIARYTTEHRRIPLNSIVRTNAAWGIFVCVVANAAFIRYWQDQFRDPQSFAINARNTHRAFYVVDLGRDGSSDPQIKLQIDPSSHPSVGFYYQKPIEVPAETEPLQTPALVLSRGEPPAWIARQARAVVRAGKYYGSYID